MPAGRVDYAVDSDALRMSLDSAFWVYNLVAHMAYTDRHSEVWPLLQERIRRVQRRLFDQVSPPLHVLPLILP